METVGATDDLDALAAPCVYVLVCGGSCECGCVVVCVCVSVCVCVCVCVKEGCVAVPPFLPCVLPLYGVYGVEATMLGVRHRAQRNGQASWLACVCGSQCKYQRAPGAQTEWTYVARTRACVSASRARRRDAGHRSTRGNHKTPASLDSD